MSSINSNEILKKIIDRGVPIEKIEPLKYSWVNLHKWFEGFDNVEESVSHSVYLVQNHPLLPPTTPCTWISNRPTNRST